MKCNKQTDDARGTMDVVVNVLLLIVCFIVTGLLEAPR